MITDLGEFIIFQKINSRMENSPGYGDGETCGTVLSKWTIISRWLTQYYTVQREEHTMILHILPESTAVLEVQCKIHEKRMGFLAFSRNNRTVSLYSLTSRWDVYPEWRQLKIWVPSTLLRSTSCVCYFNRTKKVSKTLWLLGQGKADQSQFILLEGLTCKQA